MNIEDYRSFCLSLGPDVVEKMPFSAFRQAAEVLVFYVAGHMFAFFDCNTFSVVTLKCQPDRIVELKEREGAVGDPYNMSARHWIGVDATMASDALLRELTLNSYTLVREGKKVRQCRQRT